MLWDTFDILDATVHSQEGILDVSSKNVEVNQVLDEMWIHTYELSS